MGGTRVSFPIRSFQFWTECAELLFFYCQVFKLNMTYVLSFSLDSTFKLGQLKFKMIDVTFKQYLHIKIRFILVSFDEINSKIKMVYKHI